MVVLRALGVVPDLRRYLLCAALVVIAGCNDGGSNASRSAAAAAPTISGTPVSQVQVGQPYSFTPSTPAAGRGAVSFSVANKPSWASFSIATGQLSGTPTSADVGNYSNVIISVSNGGASASLPAFGIAVVGPSGTVTLAWAAPTMNTNGTPLTDLAGYTIDYGTSAAALSQSITIGTPSTTTDTVQNLSAGTWYFAITAYTSDGVQSALSSVVSTTVQ